jgi:hypothetical protein
MTEKEIKTIYILNEIPFNTSKSFSEALTLASTNPQYDDRLFIE